MKKHHMQSIVALRGFRDKCLKLLCDVMNINSAISYLVDSGGKPIFYEKRGIPDLVYNQYLQTFYKFDPLHPSKIQDHDEKIISMNTLVAPHERSNHPFFEGFVRPSNIRDIVELFFRMDGKLTSGIAIVLMNNGKSELRSDEFKKLFYFHDFIDNLQREFFSSATSSSFDIFCDDYLLTSRERTVLELMVHGLQNKSIAENLCCCLPTVKTHIQNIFRKIQVNSRVEAVNMVYSYTSLE